MFRRSSMRSNPGSLSLPTQALLSILGQLGKKAGERAACVKREWRDVVETAKTLGMYRTEVFYVAAGGREQRFHGVLSFHRSEGTLST